jgi:hypothetical protein
MASISAGQLFLVRYYGRRPRGDAPLVNTSANRCDAGVLLDTFFREAALYRARPTHVREVRHNGGVHASSRKGGAMFARVTRYSVHAESLPQAHRAIENHVVPALMMQPGYSGGLLLGNPDSGKMLSVTLWENEQQMHATDEASHWFRAFGAEAAEGTVTDVETYEVYRARLAHQEP